MKQSLQLRQGLQITMTPQLQQAIRLLQLSTIELQTEIQQTLESNIMLEVVEDEEDEFEKEDAPTIDLAQEGEEVGVNSSTAGLEETQHLTTVASDHDELSPETSEISLANLGDIPDDQTIDTGWEEVYDSTLSPYDYSTNNNNDDANGKDLSPQNSQAQSLQDHLRWQLELTPFSDVDHAIALAIIDALDDDGYLRTPLEELLQSVGKHVREDTIEEAEAVLHRVQHFDPVGVAARNLSECLQLQLEECDPNTPWLKEARILVSKHLELLGTHNYIELSKRLKIEREELREVIDLIRSLKPRPSSQLESQPEIYVIPDAYVRKAKGQWKVELNSEISPKLRVNPYYASLVSRINNHNDVTSLKNHLQEARWFIKSLKSRHETLLKVANCIVKRQTAFLEYGEEAMKPLVLHDIASELEMHESTISRVTTQKYLHTPRGMFELKYFFSSHVSTNNGGECSSTAVRALIEKLIANESTTKPLSDSKIAKLLSDRGINVARRTVAKYREAMLIPSSNDRKSIPEEF